MDDFWTPALQVELLPCAASSARMWVNQLVNSCSTPCSTTGKMQNYTSSRYELRLCKWNFYLAQLHLLGCEWTNLSTLVQHLVQRLERCRTTTSSRYEQLGTSFYLQELLCRREEVVLREFHLSESVVFHSVQLGVFLLVVCVFCVCVSELFCFDIWKTSG